MKKKIGNRSRAKATRKKADLGPIVENNKAIYALETRIEKVGRAHPVIGKLYRRRDRLQERGSGFAGISWQYEVNNGT